MAHGRLYVSLDRCTGCRACEVACVVAHEGVFGRAAARIKVVKHETVGLDDPRVCQMCGDVPCVGACPVEALRVERANGSGQVAGTVTLSAGRCIACGACVEACPFGGARLHPQTGIVLICDLCGGDPACVKHCATGAIIYREAGLQARTHREAGVP